MLLNLLIASAADSVRVFLLFSVNLQSSTMHLSVQECAKDFFYLQLCKLVFKRLTVWITVDSEPVLMLHGKSMHSDTAPP